MIRILAAALPLFLLAACSDPDEPRAATHGGAPEAEQDVHARTILASLDPHYADADLEAGRQHFRRCATCHTLGDGGRDGVGPNLHGLFGREVGTHGNFPYSPALQEADFTWSPEELDSWLSDPRGYLPGNRMSFAGLREEEDRRDLIGYLAVETAR